MAGFSREIELHLRDLSQRLSDCSRELEHIERSPVSPCLFSQADRANLLRAAKEAAKACERVRATEFHPAALCSKKSHKKVGR